ncbi:TetR family transcriptional regulator C-terminal domain-containing protein [Temperatibacter marinus]|uniref:TetR family transcriptional regulator C-terminal domain-containing protein n=1 Tax=Temperatibacter marinus TaxID=1456591 RepID=A0AA52H988_9PROT|nr:TetR family transcriptional regulator C-terminal domain-containing protein [Temperatibacter marinus]WND02931.1 TetR family transcriptional regulator C-terminal domain-containing protein [Temperatibacter marinus]
MSEDNKARIRRRASKGYRRRQLIEATITCIAKKGLNDTTLSDVATLAGLSQGLINLHFETKDNLLRETLLYIQDEYECAWREALEKSVNEPAQRLAALIRADYLPHIMSRDKMAVWFGFWGEVKARPTYQKICREKMEERTALLVSLIEDLIVKGEYENMEAKGIADTLTALADGLWLNVLIGTQKNRTDAEQVMLNYIGQLFVRHRAAFSIKKRGAEAPL